MSFFPSSSGSGNSHSNKNMYSYGKRKKNVKTFTDEECKELQEEFWDMLLERRSLHDGQREILDDFFDNNRKYLFLRIGRKGAKTTINIMAAWAFCLLNPRSTCFITLPTITQAIEVYWDEDRLQWCDVGESSMADRFVAYVNDNKHAITFINGSTIKLIGTWSESRGRGTQPNLLIVDEVKDCKASYLDAMEPNLAAKEDARCIMSGTPPNKITHYHEWERRIINNPEGNWFKFSSYVNTSLPHLKDWLDRKKDELIAAGKEDVWLREYMAEDCFSSEDRILPDIDLVEADKVEQELKLFDSERIRAVLGVVVTEQRLCASMILYLRCKWTGVRMWVVDIYSTKQLWNMTYSEINKQLMAMTEKYLPYSKKRLSTLVHDETDSFNNVIPRCNTSRKDFNWKNRGIPLLKEMILNNNLITSNKVDSFAVESQNILKGEDIFEYPSVCTLAMLANEYYQGPSLSRNDKAVWDKYAPLRDAGLIAIPPAKKKNILWSTGWK